MEAGKTFRTAAATIPADPSEFCRLIVAKIEELKRQDRNKARPIGVIKDCHVAIRAHEVDKVLAKEVAAKLDAEKVR